MELQQQQQHPQLVWLLSMEVQILVDPLTPGVLSAPRNPPADHWCLVSGLPTYVAETGLVSVVFYLTFHVRSSEK